MQAALSNPSRLIALIGALAALGAATFVLKTFAGPSAETTVAPLPPQPAAKKPAQKTPPPPVAENGLPRAVATALLRDRVVVVAVAAPGAPIDELAVREAQAGAALAGAGFVRLNAFRNIEIAPFAEKVGLRQNPAVVVLRRPAVVAFQLGGFADRDSVAQAATDARG